MTVDEVSFFEYAFKGLVSVVLAVGAWLWNGVVADVKENESKINKLERDVDQYKLHISDNYVKNNVLDRIDGTMLEMQKDIKIIIGKLGNGGGKL